MQRYGVIFRSRNCAFHKIKHFFSVTDVPPVFSCSVPMTFPRQVYLFSARYNKNSSFAKKHLRINCHYFLGLFGHSCAQPVISALLGSRGWLGASSCCSFAQERGGEAHPASVSTSPGKKEATNSSQPKAPSSSSLSLFPTGKPCRATPPTKEPFFRQRPLHPGRKGASSLEKGGLSCLPLVPTTIRMFWAAAACYKWVRKGWFMVGVWHRKLCREER